MSLIMSGAGEGTEHKLHVPKDSIHQEELPLEPVLPVTGILFSGNLKTMTLEKKTPAIPIIAEAAQ